MTDHNHSTTSVQTVFRILVVSLLNEEPMSGYDLIKAIEDLTGDRPSQGKIYPFLHDLLKCGQIEERLEASDEVRDKKIYSLSIKGMKILDEVYSQLQYFLKNYLTTCSSCGCKFLDAKDRDIFEREFDDFYCCKACKQYKM